MKLSELLVAKYTDSRLLILASLGYTPISARVQPTRKGYHMWFTVLEQMPEQEASLAQFFLGDDQKRCAFNELRVQAGCFDIFNALFSKKVKRHKIPEAIQDGHDKLQTL